MKQDDVFTAERARRQTNATLAAERKRKEIEAEKDESVKDILTLVVVATNRGLSSIQLTEWDKNYPNPKQVKVLKELGYKLHYFPGGEFDTPEDYTISW